MPGGRAYSVVKGLLMTLSLSPRLAFREAVRRLTGRPYRYNGVPVGSSADFRLLRSALKLVAEDDLGLKKPTGPTQAFTTSNTPAQQPGTPEATLQGERQHPKASTSIVLGATAAIIAVAIAAALAKR
ncbi:MAG: hypothetical protein GSR80_000033 [Desulfurococcales archaeon]|nr:hypothetical protein [Desulfurococcales archaeon]